MGEESSETPHEHGLQLWVRRALGPRRQAPEAIGDRTGGEETILDPGNQSHLPNANEARTS